MCTIRANGARINGVIAHIISHLFSWNNNALPILSFHLLIQTLSKVASACFYFLY